jgi:septum formation topological specificity factor MinE
VVASTSGLLRERAIALEPLDADLQQQLVLVHQRGGKSRIGLLPFQRHPIMTVISEQVEPFLEALLIDQTRLADNKLDQIVVARRGHGGARHIDIVMNFDQARN